MQVNFGDPRDSAGQQLHPKRRLGCAPGFGFWTCDKTALKTQQIDICRENGVVILRCKEYKFYAVIKASEIFRTSEQLEVSEHGWSHMFQAFHKNISHANNNLKKCMHSFTWHGPRPEIRTYPPGQGGQRPPRNHCNALRQKSSPWLETLFSRFPQYVRYWRAADSCTSTLLFDEEAKKQEREIARESKREQVKEI